MSTAPNVGIAAAMDEDFNALTLSLERARGLQYLTSLVLEKPSDDPNERFTQDVALQSAHALMDSMLHEVWARAHALRGVALGRSRPTDESGAQ